MGTRVSSGTISNLNQKAYENIEKWRSQPLTGKCAYVYVDGMYLKRSWGCEVQNVSVLVAIGVNQDGYREILGAAEGMKEDQESWRNFFVLLKGRGLSGVRLLVGDRNLGMLETIGEIFSEARYQRCIVHFYRNVFSVIPHGKVREVAMMLDTMPDDKLPSACIGCGQCAQVCPQKIDIPKAMADFTELMPKLPNWSKLCEERAAAAKALKMKK